MTVAGAPRSYQGQSFAGRNKDDIEAARNSHPGAHVVLNAPNIPVQTLPAMPLGSGIPMFPANPGAHIVSNGANIPLHAPPGLPFPPGLSMAHTNPGTHMMNSSSNIPVPALPGLPYVPGLPVAATTNPTPSSTSARSRTAGDQWGFDPPRLPQHPVHTVGTWRKEQLNVPQVNFVSDIGRVLEKEVVQHQASSVAQCSAKDIDDRLAEMMYPEYNDDESEDIPLWNTKCHKWRVGRIVRGGFEFNAEIESEDGGVELSPPLTPAASSTDSLERASVIAQYSPRRSTLPLPSGFEPQTVHSSTAESHRSWTRTPETVRDCTYYSYESSAEEAARDRLRHETSPEMVQIRPIAPYTNAMTEQPARVPLVLAFQCFTVTKRREPETVEELRTFAQGSPVGIMKDIVSMAGMDVSDDDDEPYLLLGQQQLPPRLPRVTSWPVPHQSDKPVCETGRPRSSG